MTSTSHVVKVQLDTTALDKINAKWREAFEVVAKEREDLVTLTDYMANGSWDDGIEYSAQDLAYAVVKPHKFADVLAEAKAALEAEAQR